MDDQQLARVPTIERYDRDCDDWEAALKQIRTWIDECENSHNPADFVYLRKQIKDVLDEIKDAKRFIRIKREYVGNVTADADALFAGDRPATQLGELQEGQRQPDEATLE